LTSLLNPAKFEQESEDWLGEIKAKLLNYKSTEGSMPVTPSAEIRADKVDAIKHSPLPAWLENLTKNYLQSRDISYNNLLNGIRFKFPGLKENIYTFNIRESVNNPIPEPVSLQHEIIRTILNDAVPFTESQQIPIIKIKSGSSSSGLWSLWHLEVKNQFETNQVIHPIFLSSKGENFSAFAQTIWDKLIQEINSFDCIGVMPPDKAKQIFEDVSRNAEEILQAKYEELEKNITQNTAKIKSNKENSFAFQEKQMNRIGIENIRLSRLNRLYKEKEAMDSTFISAGLVVPSLTCLLMLSIVDE
jgi:hypothetical protein